LTAVTLTVHRGTRQIGGNCVEVRAPGGERLVLDVGRPLDASSDATGLLPETLDRTQPATVLISHPHQDHWGLLSEVPAEWPVHCGEATAKLMRLTAGVKDGCIERAFIPWTNGLPVGIGPFAVTPLLTDHSAFDAHMLLIEVAGKRILYSGDFRRHGRKAKLVRQLMASPPNVDILLLEGTNLGSSKPTTTEQDLEAEFVGLFRRTPGRVFVSWSAQNIDRTVTLYRACLKARRVLVIDLYTAEVLTAINPHAGIPQPGWPGLKVVITSAFARLYRMKGRDEFVTRMAEGSGMPARVLAESPRRWVIMTRPSLIRDYRRAGVNPTTEDAWCWSMWRGYLDREDNRRVQDWFEINSASVCHIHTSGHASAEDLRAFAAALKPLIVVPIHGNAWDEHVRGFPHIRRLRDGEPMLV